MILSVSRRTDIPAFYWKWFLNRVKAGFVDVRNPINIHQVSRVDIRPEVVDCIVFWTKNASNILQHLNQLREYNYYFQYTINPYNAQIEEKVPTKQTIIDNFRSLSNIVGSNRVIWRYDPILFTGNINIEYHLRYFEELAKRLQGHTQRCVISFVDLYKKTVSNTKGLLMREPTENEMRILAKKISTIAQKYDMEVFSCSEYIELNSEGVKHGCCIDRNLIENIIGYKVDVRKDPNQRKECGCVQSIDLGTYNTCLHACKYCYANSNNFQAIRMSQMHNPLSTLLVGELDKMDVIKERKVKSFRTNGLFDF